MGRGSETQQHPYLQIFVLKLSSSNFQALEAVGRGGETQLQVGENLNRLT